MHEPVSGLRFTVVQAIVFASKFGRGDPGRVKDAPFGLVLLAGDALGIDAEEHRHAVPCPLSSLRRRYPGIEPSGDSGMAECIRHVQQWRAGFSLGQRCPACLVEHLQIGAVGDDPSAWANEQAPIGAGTELVQVLAQHRHQFGMDRHVPCITLRPMLERASLAGLAAVSPEGAVPWCGVRQDHFTPSLPRKADQIFETQA